MAFDPTGSFVATKSSTMARRTWARLLSFIADLPTRLALVHTECQFYASSRLISFRLPLFRAIRHTVGGSLGFGLRGPVWWMPVNAFHCYCSDVLAGDYPASHRPKKSRPVEIGLDMVLEDAMSGYVGAVVGAEKTKAGVVVNLEDRQGRVRAFPLGPGFLLEGQPVELRLPTKQKASGAARPRDSSRAV